MQSLVRKVMKGEHERRVKVNWNFQIPAVRERAALKPKAFPRKVVIFSGIALLFLPMFLQLLIGFHTDLPSISRLLYFSISFLKLKIMYFNLHT